MVALVQSLQEHLWHNGLAVIPLVILVTLLTRWLPSRPATRHTLWVMILLWLVLPPMLPSISGAPISEWIDSKRVPLTHTPVEDVLDGFSSHEQPRRLPINRDFISPEAQDTQYPRRLKPAARFVEDNFADDTDGKIALPASPCDFPCELKSTTGADEKIAFDQQKWTRPSARLPGVRTGRAAYLQDYSALHQHSPAPQTLARDRLRNCCGPMDGYCFEHQPDNPYVNKITAHKDSTQSQLLRPTITLMDEYKIRLLYDIARACYDTIKQSFFTDHNNDPLAMIALADNTKPHRSETRNIKPKCKNCPSRTAANTHKMSPPKLQTRTTWSNNSDTKASAATKPIQTRTTFENKPSTPTWVEWAAWLTAITVAWDTMVAIPPIPTSLWFGVALILFAIVLIRTTHFQKRLANAKKAPRCVKRIVADVANEIGLGYVPQTLMVEGRISPMIWCSFKPKLILPMRLWSQLDDMGRRAVIFHELAHLRRGDHWVNWMDTAIGNLFWWHPLVWWVRHRLHMEAEDCCDAWVTTLMPQKRRVYAETLLKTKQYLGAQHAGVAVMGIGITSGRARRFARRLTMVMTQSVKPRLSISGFALVLAMAMTGWLASPAQSNEPKAKAETKAAVIAPVKVFVEQNEPITTYEKHVQAKAAAAPAVSVPTTFFVQPSVVAPTVAAVGQDKGDRRKNADKRINQLEKKLERLSEQLEKLSEHLSKARNDDDDDADDDEDVRSDRHRPRYRDGRSRDNDGPGARRSPRAPRAPRAPKAPCAPEPPCAQSAPPPPHPGPGPHGFGIHKGDHPFPGPRAFFGGDDGEEIWKTYHLPEGKLEAFTALMIREDVPVKVRPQPDAIDILGTPHHHALWHGFFQMIDPSDKRAGDTGDFYRTFIAGGHPGPFGIGCCGKAGDGCKDCCKGKGKGNCKGDCKGGCKGDCKGGCKGDCKSNCKKGCKDKGCCGGRGSGWGIGAGWGCDTPGCDKCKNASKIKAEARGIKDKIRKELTEIRAKTRGDIERIRDRARQEVDQVRERIRSHARNARTQANSNREVHEALHRQEEALREQAEEIREQAERVREQANEVRERASQIVEDEPENEGFERHVSEMEAHSAALEEQSRQLEEQSQVIEESASKIEEQIEQMERHAEDLDERAEAIRDASDSLNDSQSSPELANSIIALAHYVDEVANPVLASTTDVIQGLIDTASEVSQDDESVEKTPEANKNSDD